MAFQEIARGGASSLLRIDQYDREYREGQRGELRIGIRQLAFVPDLPAGFISSLQLALDQVPGLEVGRVRFGDDNIVRIPFRRGLPPLVLIAAILAIFFVGAILLLVTAWSLFREPVAAIIDAAADVGKAIGENLKPIIIGGVVLGLLYLLTQGGKKGLKL